MPLPPEFGKKHTCFKCGHKFYDLNKPDPICPQCQANQLEMPKKENPPSPPPLSKPSRISTPPDPMEEPEMTDDEVEEDLPEIDEVPLESLEEEESEEEY